MSDNSITSDQLKHLFPNYSDIVEVNKGGFKTVFIATRNNRKEIIKAIGLPQTGLIANSEQFYEECLQRALREIKILSSCESPAIVKLGDFKPQIIRLDSGQYVIYSEEHLDGQDLAALISSQTEKPSEGECRALMRQLLLAISELWNRRFIHRDIKPQNIIKLQESSRPFVLLDLGIAFSLADTALTFNAEHRLPPATYKYLAPEMGNPNFRTNIDYRSDLYSAALTVYEYAARIHPLFSSNDDLLHTFSKALHESPKPLKHHRPDLSPNFCNLIDQLLKKKPALRPANLGRLITQMEQ